MSGTWNGNSIAYGAGGHWYVQFYVSDDGANSGPTTGLHISYRVVFEQSVSDSMNSINGSDPAGSWSADNHAFGGAGSYLVAQRDFQCGISYGGSTAHITMSASGLPGGGTSTVTIDYPMPARGSQYTAPDEPETGVDTITSSSARIVVFASANNGGAAIDVYEGYVLTTNQWPFYGVGGNVLVRAYGGTFTATGLRRATRYYYTARAHNVAGLWSIYRAMRVFDTLATAPDPPSPVTISDVTQNSVATLFYGRNNGGAAIVRWELGYGTDPNTPQTIVTNNTGVLAVNGLISGTDYYFWSRGVNAIGNGAWSTRSTSKTLPAIFVNVAGVQKNATPYVCVSNGVWKRAIRYVNVNGVWHQ